MAAALDPSKEPSKARPEIDLGLFFPRFASSSFDPGHGPEKSRFDLLHSREGADVWCAAVNDVDQFLGISFADQALTLTGISTRGRVTHDQYVKRFLVDVTLDGSTWHPVDNAKIFEGTTDATTVVRQNFSQPVLARAIRIRPVVWNNHISTKLAVHGFFSE